jgi:hypothetical protein
MNSANAMRNLDPPVSPNKHMQRAGTHKVLGRGRESQVPCSALRARVLIGRRAGADVNRSATLLGPPAFC